MSTPADRPPLRVLFVDDGGVLSDNERRAPEWRRLVGEFFAPRLGGTAGAWAAANAAVFPMSWTRYLTHLRTAVDGVRPFLQSEDRRWLRDMCDAVGVACPDDGEELDELVGAAQRYITRNVASAYPDAAQAIRDVARSGIALHTASGGTSLQLDGYLRAMGLRELFDRLYGVDLIDRFKSGPHYYRAILAASGVDPREAAVVDDTVEALDWAASCGLRTIQVARGGGGIGQHEVVAGLGLLPHLL